MKANVRTYKDIKICCYAMAAGEPHEFIDRWLESMSGADYITVLITKENDNNYDYFLEKQKLPEFKNKLIVEQKTISPWRFDVARNESMKLIPKDTDACVCTDIDEILIPDFWDDYRKLVFEHPNFERIYYRYAWSHDNETGDPKWVFWYDKTHKPNGWYWDYPVHEALRCSEEDKKAYNYSGCYKLDANKIYLHHYPDNTKSRGSYLGLLQQRADEYPKDLYGLYYLMREYMMYGQFENALKTATCLYVRLKQPGANDDMMMFCGVCNFIGDCYFRFHLDSEAEFFYRKGLAADPTLRDSYIKLASLYAYSGHAEEAYKTLEVMEQKSVRREEWRLISYYWRFWKKAQVIAIAKANEGKFEESKEWFEKGLLDINTPDDQNDARKEGFYGDYAQLQEKLKEG